MGRGGLPRPQRSCIRSSAWLATGMEGLVIRTRSRLILLVAKSRISPTMCARRGPPTSYEDFFYHSQFANLRCYWRTVWSMGSAFLPLRSPLWPSRDGAGKVNGWEMNQKISFRRLEAISGSWLIWFSYHCCKMFIYPTHGTGG